MSEGEATAPATISVIQHRVDYSETDQMGVVYHARYLVWLDIARTEHLRRTGVSYRQLEQLGLRLMVSDLSINYRRAARYDDPIRVRTWVTALASRKITFGYAVEHDERGDLLATATTALLVLNHSFAFARLPQSVAATLIPILNPVRA